MLGVSSNSVSTTRSSTARVRLHRQRRATGVRFVATLQIPITEALVASLIGRGSIVPQLGPDGERRVTRSQIIQALKDVLSCA
jgi:hypothetical protein